MGKSGFRFIPFLILFLAFYVLPLGITDTGAAISVMLIVIPALCFVSGFIDAWKNGFHAWFAILAAVLFVPTIWFYYNSSAWIYAVIYAVFALVGTFIGKLMPKKK